MTSNPTPAEKVAMELVRYHREDMDIGIGEGTLFQRVVPRLPSEDLYWRALRMVGEEEDFALPLA